MQCSMAWILGSACVATVAGGALALVHAHDVYISVSEACHSMCGFPMFSGEGGTRPAPAQSSRCSCSGGCNQQGSCRTPPKLFKQFCSNTSDACYRTSGWSCCCSNSGNSNSGSQGASGLSSSINSSSFPYDAWCDGGGWCAPLLWQLAGPGWLKEPQLEERSGWALQQFHAMAVLSITPLSTLCC